MILLFVFGALAALAAYATLGDDDLRWIGFWLVIGFILSNVLHATMSVSYLPGPYSVIEIMVLLAASLAWDSHRHCWPLLILTSVNIFSICVNIVFASLGTPTLPQIYLFELMTNLCFTAECLLAMGVGIYHEYRSDRFRSLSGLWSRTVAPYVARTESESD